MDDLKEERLRIPVDDDELDAVAVSPSQGTHRWAILVHGGPGGVKDGPADLYRDLAGVLAAQGIGSLRFDVRGAGQSTGAYRDMTLARQVRDLRAARELLAERYAPRRTALIGESLGATIVLAGLDGEEDTLVLLWPAIWLLEDVFDSYLTEESLAEASERGFIVRDGEEIGLPFLNELLATRDVAGPLRGSRTPLLLVHGDADTEVPVEQSARAEALVAGPVRRVVVPGGEHCLERPSERAVVNRETSAWLAAHL
ncbi:alpha/beta hydrolase family protein [Streptomyces specialis]|uniref:alpha/beta hydrolase family protein n=1 Tax=Streptomyces specialis TaxID=498367 RepID=UPI00073E5EB3|nr:alpha/beta fold hydrolase [Streptomyces specialis]